jgi:ABC-type Fe3+/spermidine/putrescine transport system ATPase subunit
LRAATDLPVAAGQTVKVMIRPERLRLRPIDRTQAGDNCIPGLIAEKTFLGEATKYYASVSAEQTFVSKALTTTQASTCGPGDRVLLTVEPDSIVILDAGSAAACHSPETQ